jgi:aspartate kinase
VRHGRAKRALNALTGTKALEKQHVTGITYSKDEAKIMLRGVEDRPGVAAAIFGPLTAAGIEVDMMVETPSEDTMTTDIAFTVPLPDFEHALAVVGSLRASVPMKEISGAGDVAKISVMGNRVRSDPGIAAAALGALAGEGIAIQAITRSKAKISLLINAADTELAVRTLHATYALERP